MTTPSSVCEPRAKPRSPIAFTFIKSTESMLPVTLLPPMTPGVLGPSSLPKSDAGTSEPTSPHRHRSTNFQDLLVFDPTDGILSLRRIFVDLRPRDQCISVPTSVSLGATSVSLPGMGGAGRLGPSPPPPSMRAGGAVSTHVKEHRGQHGPCWKGACYCDVEFATPTRLERDQTHSGGASVRDISRTDANFHD